MKSGLAWLLGLLRVTLSIDLLYLHKVFRDRQRPQLGHRRSHLFFVAEQDSQDFCLELEFGEMHIFRWRTSEDSR
jgi:hypothetical protein